jgi:hypothetical protein
VESSSANGRGRNVNKKEAEDACICSDCPTYVDCHEPLAFCMWDAGKSKCIKEENGCICPDCPVQTDMHFGHEFYCTRGSEKELRRQ